MSSGAAKLFIATPTTNGLMLSDYVDSLARMMARLHGRGIGTDYRTIDGPNLVLQRDMLADAFLKSDATHLLFIDSDMAFEPGLAERLLSFAKPVIGTIYPRRSLDLEAAEAASSRRMASTTRSPSRMTGTCASSARSSRCGAGCARWRASASASP